MKLLVTLAVSIPFASFSQEASSGFALRTTVSGMTSYSDRLQASPRFGSPLVTGFRSMFYPTWKLNSKWSVAGAVQVYTRPYFAEQFTTQGHGIKADVLQAHLSYSRIAADRSLVIKAGQLSSAFGSFLLRYDDAANPLIDMPQAYGYYYKPVSSLGLAGVQIDATVKRFDMRAQFVNSSPANRRSLWDRDQYGNWAGGLGYTVVQGFRVGASAYYGPYLHRQYVYFFPGEDKPKDLPASAIGLDVQWAAGHWNAEGEFQSFKLAYRAIPTFSEQTGYAELRRVLNPRWFAAARIGYLRPSLGLVQHAAEGSIGYRPYPNQLVKLGYGVLPAAGTNRSGRVVALQYVTTFSFH